MALLSWKPSRPVEEAAPVPPRSDVRVTGFERRVCAGTVEGGVLCYEEWGRPKQALVALTWDALATLRLALEQAGRPCPDGWLIAAVLRQWGKEEIERRAVTALASPPLPELVLSFAGGPTSDAPRSLLERAGLL